MAVFTAAPSAVAAAPARATAPAVTLPAYAAMPTSPASPAAPASPARGLAPIVAALGVLLAAAAGVILYLVTRAPASLESTGTAAATTPRSELGTSAPESAAAADSSPGGGASAGSPRPSPRPKPLSSSAPVAPAASSGGTPPSVPTIPVPKPSASARTAAFDEALANKFMAEQQRFAQGHCFLTKEEPASAVVNINVVFNPDGSVKAFADTDAPLRIRTCAAGMFSNRTLKPFAGETQKRTTILAFKR